MSALCLFFQAEGGIRDLVRSRGLGDVYKRQEGEPDWAALLELAASIGEQLAVANMAGEAAREALGELLLRLDEYRLG